MTLSLILFSLAVEGQGCKRSRFFNTLDIVTMNYSRAVNQCTIQSLEGTGDCKLVDCKFVARSCAQYIICTISIQKHAMGIR